MKKLICMMILMLLITNVFSDQTWHDSVRKDPLNDNTIITFALRAISGENVYNAPIDLGIRITEEKNKETVNITCEVIINWKCYLGDEMRKIIYRFDDDKAITEFASLSSNNEATYFSNPNDIAIRLLSSKRFVVQIVPFEENPITAIFDTTGLQKLMDKYSITFSYNNK